MAFPDRRTANILLTILLFGVVCVALYYARRILLIFVLAIFFAYLIDPAVKFLQRHSFLFRNLRGPAVMEVYFAFAILIGLAGYTFAMGQARNTVKLVDEVPAFLNSLSTGDIATDLRGEYGWSKEQELRFRAFLARHKADIQNLVPALDRYLSDTVEVLGWLLLIPVLAIFFLRDGEHIAGVLIQMMVPANRRARIRALANELHLMLNRYIRAQVILCSLSFLFYSAVSLLLGFPHAIALGVLGGLLEFVPIVGWMSAFAVIVGLGVVNHLHWMAMAALLAAWRVIQDYFLSPPIMGRQLKIHPLAAIFAVLVGAEIGGVVGVYLAVPLMAAMRVIWRVCANEQPVQDCRSAGATSNTPAILAETVTN